MKKLLQCGFEKKRCIDAFQENDGDLGAVLQFLLRSCCELNQLGRDNPDYTEEKFQETVFQWLIFVIIHCSASDKLTVDSFIVLVCSPKEKECLAICFQSKICE